MRQGMRRSEVEEDEEELGGERGRRRMTKLEGVGRRDGEMEDETR